MDNQVEIIMRQTNYDENLAKEKLTMHNNNTLKVIEEYFGFNNKITEEKIISVNQEKYKQFRNLMDNASENYRNKIRNKTTN